MSKRQPRTVRVDPDVWSAFVNQVVDWEGQKHGKLGVHVETALSEYIDHGQTARIEDKVDRILAHVSDGSGTHTHVHVTNRASETVEKARDVYKRIADNHGTVIKDDDVTRAVEDIAGADERTVNKYKGILKRRSLLFAHPGDSPVWTVEREKWVQWCENYIDNNPTMEAIDIIDDYDLTEEQYHDLADTMIRVQ